MSAFTYKTGEAEPISRDTVLAAVDFSKYADELNGEAIGLVNTVVQDEKTKDVLMVAFMNAAALEKTLATGMATFWTRSRKRLWTKGEESGNFMKVTGIAVDCDRDAVLLTVRPQGDGKACHTGQASCFYRSFPV